MEIQHDKHAPIGFLDSGVGGISVLREAVAQMPCEDFIYYGDSAHAPYGSRPAEEILELTGTAVEYLLGRGVKAIVIACNTATSVAAGYLRDKYCPLPIIGIEPALKPAVLGHRGGRVAVMATPVTVHQQKFRDLAARYEGIAQIEPMGCDGLMDFVEQGIVEGPVLEDYLRKLFAAHGGFGFDAVVLGCTHYPFIKDTLRKLLGKDTDILDGSEGTARELGRRLREEGLLTDHTRTGRVEFVNSGGEEMTALSRRLFAGSWD